MANPADFQSFFGPVKADAATEALLTAHARALTLSLTRTLAWVTLLQAIFFWPLDQVVFAESASAREAFSQWRPAVVAYSGLVLLLLRVSPALRRRARWTAGTGIVLCTALSSAFMSRLGGIESDLYACSYVLPLCNGVLMVPLRWRVLFAVSLQLAWNVPYLLAGGEVGRDTLGVAISFSAFACSAGIVFGELLWRTTCRSVIQQLDIAAAAARTRTLLLNILPAAVAERLEAGEGRIADALPDVSVLFADIVGFTALSERLPAAELVGLLDRIFTRLDALADLRGLEKIKTIGDAYMVVGGLPGSHPDHLAALAALALDMLDAVRDLARDTGHPLNLRMGLHCGPAVAGVIGARKFAYDVWGDTVNMASRMESQGAAGEIQVTEAVRARLAGVYAFEPRGEIEVRGKGTMPTFWLRPQ